MAPPVELRMNELLHTLTIENDIIKSGFNLLVLSHADSLSFANSTRSRSQLTTA